MIHASGLSVTRGQRRILSDLSFELQPGRFYGLVGPNGSGKTTLLRCLAGCEPPDQAGSLELGRERRALRAGYVLQDPERQGILPSLREELVFGPANLLVPEKALKSQVAVVTRWLALDVAHAADVFLEELSLGQQQTVAVGAVLTMFPLLLLLDEPTASLDDANATICMRAIAALRARSPELIVVLATHDPRLLASADEVIALRQGRRQVPRADGVPPARPEEPSRALISPRSRTADDLGPRLLSARDLALGYGTETLLSRVSVDLHAGECVAVLGRNGAGKSTLLHALAGLHPLQSGELTCEGGMSVRVVLQRADAAMFCATVTEEVAMGMAVADPRDKLGKVTALLQDLGLADLAQRDVKTLSGGEARLVSIAAILATSPDVLALDEPFAGLDPDAKASVRRILEQLLDGGKAVLVVSHLLSDVAHLANRYLLIAEGTAALASPSEIDDHVLAKLGLGQDPGKVAPWP